jgi:hypothetical protein
MRSRSICSTRPPGSLARRLIAATPARCLVGASEFALRHPLLVIGVGGGEHTHVHRSGRVSPSGMISDCSSAVAARASSACSDADGTNRSLELKVGR